MTFARMLPEAFPKRPKKSLSEMVSYETLEETLAEMSMGAL